MRAQARRYAVLPIALLIAALAPPLSSSAAPRQTEPIVLEDVFVGEVPNSVAVADSGVIAASLSDDKSVVLLPGAGVVTRVPLDCAPSDVAIAPDGSTAWAVCQGDPHVYVIDVASGGRQVADVGLQEAEDVVYLPASRRLIIADLAGEIVVVSATGIQDYAVVERVSTGAERPSDLAILSSGERGFATTDAGRLLAIDLKARTSRVMPGLAPDAFLSSIDLSRSGTLLYAGASIGSNGSGFRSAVLALDPVTAETLQESPLEFTLPVSTPISVAAGYRSLSVGSGFSLQVDGESTGLFDIAIDVEGRLGERSRIMPPGVSIVGSDVSRSADGRVISAGTMNDTVVGARVDDAAYPPTLRVQGTLSGTKLTLTGATTGMQPGTRVTVYVKDMTKSKSRFVKQPKAAVVDARGNYRWTSTVKAAKVSVFTKTPAPAASPQVTIKRTKR